MKRGDGMHARCFMLSVDVCVWMCAWMARWPKMDISISGAKCTSKNRLNYRKCNGLFLDIWSEWTCDMERARNDMYILKISICAAAHWFLQPLSCTFLWCCFCNRLSHMIHTDYFSTDKLYTNRPNTTNKSTSYCSSFAFSLHCHANLHILGVEQAHTLHSKSFIEFQDKREMQNKKAKGKHLWMTYSNVLRDGKVSHHNNLAWLFLPDVRLKWSPMFGNVSRFHFKAINSSDSFGMYFPAFLHKKSPLIVRSILLFFRFIIPNRSGWDFSSCFLSFVHSTFVRSGVASGNFVVILLLSSFLKQFKAKRKKNTLSNHNLHIFKVICVRAHKLIIAGKIFWVFPMERQQQHRQQQTHMPCDVR